MNPVLFTTSNYITSATIQYQCHLVKLIGSNQFKPLTKKFKIVVDIATKMCGRSRY